MLNLNEIAQRIAHPETCKAEDVDDLKLFCDTYPYAQIFPILYLKALSNSKDIRFEKELYNFAYRISDRAQLYQLIHSKEFPEVDEMAEITSVSDAKNGGITTAFLPVEPVVESIQVAASAPPIHSENPISSDVFPLEITASENESLQDFVESEEQTAELSPSVTVNAAEIEPVENTPPAQEDVPFELGFHETTDEVETHEKSEQLLSIDTNFEKELLAEAIAANYVINELEEVEEIEEIHVAAPNDEQPTTISHETTASFENAIHKQEIVTSRPFSDWLRSSTTTNTPAEEKKRIDEIVDQFIQDEPKISRPKKDFETELKPKKEFFSPVKKAKESLAINNMPVSETLAKIFALQGNYPKAIYAYEQLILINPEKKIFFASQIEDLKKKLNT